MHVKPELTTGPGHIHRYPGTDEFRIRLRLEDAEDLYKDLAALLGRHVDAGAEICEANLKIKEKQLQAAYESLAKLQCRYEELEMRNDELTKSQKPPEQEPSQQWPSGLPAHLDPSPSNKILLQLFYRKKTAAEQFRWRNLQPFVYDTRIKDHSGIRSFVASTADTDLVSSEPVIHVIRGGSHTGKSLAQAAAAEKAAEAGEDLYWFVEDESAVLKPLKSLQSLQELNRIHRQKQKEPESYRYLRAWETVQEGDEIELAKGGWRPVHAMIGHPISDSIVFRFRRPVKSDPPEPEYLLLRPGEEIQEGDEYRYKNGSAPWCTTNLSGCFVGDRDTADYRRRNRNFKRPDGDACDR